MTRSTGILLLAFLLTGCPFTVNQLNRLPGSQPLEGPVLINRPGPLPHEASGFEFPEWYDGFQRVTAYQYDTAGLDVSIGYNDRRPDCLIVATVYVYPTPRMSFVGASPDAVASMERRWLDSGFAQAKAEIERHHPTMHSVTIGPTETPTGASSLQGSMLTYREDDQISELRLFVYDHQWFLKYRFTYPETCQKDATARLDALVRKLPWAVAR